MPIQQFLKMADQLFKELVKPEILKIGWHLAHKDSRNDFVLDPVGHADYAFNLSDHLQYLVQEIQSGRYLPKHLLEVDVPKSGLSVRPGNVLPIEDASILHATIYLLAPKLDKKLDSSVYSYRLHPNWKEKAKKGISLFQELETPFLKSETITSQISQFESWYERWPAFEEDAKKVYLSEGYTHLTKTDIFSFFEHIDHGLLHDLLRSLLKTEEEKLLQLIFTILKGWTKASNLGMPINRGIPQGNEISSFLGNIFLIPLDRSLGKFRKKYDARWFRYVDDVKVYTRSEQDARKVVFEINNVLRQMHLNLQGGKTEILSGTELKKEHDHAKMEKVNLAFNNIEKLRSQKNSSKKITAELKTVSSYFTAFTKGLPQSVKNLKGKENRLFRRLLTTYRIAGRTRKGLNDTAYTAIKESTDLPVLRSCLMYLSGQNIKHHGEISEKLLGLLKNKELLFPYQAALVLETMIHLHPENPKTISSRVRGYALGPKLNKKSNWLVIQKAIEVITTYPYKEEYAIKISFNYSKHEHPLVRRAAVMLLTRGNKKEVRKHLTKFGHHPDSGVSRLAQYLMQLCYDLDSCSKEMSRVTNGNPSDNSLIRRIYQLYAASATEKKEIAKKVYETTSFLDKSKSQRILWHQNQIRERTKWVFETKSSIHNP